MGFFTKLLSMGEDKPLKNYQKVVEGINALEPLMEAKSDEELSHMTVELRERLDQGETLDDVLPEAFAAVREASKRTLGSVISMCSSSAVWRFMMARSPK